MLMVLYHVLIIQRHFLGNSGFPGVNCGTHINKVIQYAILWISGKPICMVLLVDQGETESLSAQTQRWPSQDVKAACVALSMVMHISFVLITKRNGNITLTVFCSLIFESHFPTPPPQTLAYSCFYLTPCYFDLGHLLGQHEPLLLT